MDSVFREANLNAPLSISRQRKLGEGGYRTKCKEKFENVQKYHNRTKHTQPARQHLEALCHNTATAPHMPVTTTADIFPLSAGFPTPIPSFPTLPPPPQPPPPQATTSSSVHMSFNAFPHNLTLPMPLPMTAANSIDLGISSNTSTSSFSHEIQDDDKEGDAESEGQPSNLAGSSRKRKRFSVLTTRMMMMECFEKVLKQVTQKQEEMQVKFLQIIDKGENDRMIRDEAWRRQKMARLNREEELIAQHRAGSAPRYAAIVSFLQTLTGQTIKCSEPVITSPPAAMQPIIMAVPEQQIPPRDSTNSMSMETVPCRWPKTEILALINLRSELEIKYQETSPKGPLWEEISAGMQGLGYKRNAKRCKEKWENINKYYKKVKESHKERPKDSKTCPYYHQLDAIYQRKVVGGAGHYRLSLSENTNIEDSPVEAQFCNKNDGGGVRVNVLSSSLFQLGNGGVAKEVCELCKKNGHYVDLDYGGCLRNHQPLAIDSDCSSRRRYWGRQREASTSDCYGKQAVRI